MIRADKGDTVKVNYTGKLVDGTVFDASPEDRPLQFIIGKGEVIPGFEEAVEGMFMKESKTVVISADKAYGSHLEELVEEVERSLLPEDLDVVAGGQLEVTQEDGNSFLVMVQDLTETHITLDANHPLAGRDLTFEIELLEVTKAPQA